MMDDLIKLLPDLPWARHAHRASVLKVRQRASEVKRQSERAILEHQATVARVRAEWLWRTWLFERMRGDRIRALRRRRPRRAHHSTLGRLLP
jgi:hypothetical protein